MAEEKIVVRISADDKDFRESKGRLERSLEHLKNKEKEQLKVQERVVAKTKEAISATDGLTASSKRAISAFARHTEAGDRNAARFERLIKQVREYESALRILETQQTQLSNKIQRHNQALQILSERFAAGRMSADAYRTAQINITNSQSALLSGLNNVRKGIQATTESLDLAQKEWIELDAIQTKAARAKAPKTPSTVTSANTEEVLAQIRRSRKKNDELVMASIIRQQQAEDAAAKKRMENEDKVLAHIRASRKKNDELVMNSLINQQREEGKHADLMARIGARNASQVNNIGGLRNSQGESREQESARNRAHNEEMLRQEEDRRRRQLSFHEQAVRTAMQYDRQQTSSSIAEHERGVQSARRAQEQQVAALKRRQQAERAAHIETMRRNADVIGMLNDLSMKMFVVTFASAQMFQFFIKGFVSVGEELVLFKSRLEMLTGTADAFQPLLDMSSELGIRIGDVTETFTRFAIANTVMKRTQEDLVAMTETVITLGLVSGGTTQEISNGLRQLGQGLASNRLSGDELRSVLENIPLVAVKMAEKLGVGIGTLREMGTEGKLTGEVVSQALIDIREEAEVLQHLIPDTTDKAFNRVANAWQNIIYSLVDGTDGVALTVKAFNSLAETMDSFADYVDKNAHDVISVLKTLGNVLLALFAVKLGRIAISAIALFSSSITGTMIPSLAAGRAALALYAGSFKAMVTGFGLANTALVGFSLLAKGLATVIMGPLGIALGIAIALGMSFKTRMDDQREAADELTAALDVTAESVRDLTVEELLLERARNSGAMRTQATEVKDAWKGYDNEREKLERLIQLQNSYREAAARPNASYTMQMEAANSADELNSKIEEQAEKTIKASGAVREQTELYDQLKGVGEEINAVQQEMIGGEMAKAEMVRSQQKQWDSMEKNHDKIAKKLVEHVKLYKEAEEVVNELGFLLKKNTITQEEHVDLLKQHLTSIFDIEGATGKQIQAAKTAAEGLYRTFSAESAKWNKELVESRTHYSILEGALGSLEGTSTTTFNKMVQGLREYSAELESVLYFMGVDVAQPFDALMAQSGFSGPFVQTLDTMRRSAEDLTEELSEMGSSSKAEQFLVNLATLMETAGFKAEEVDAVVAQLQKTMDTLDAGGADAVTQAFIDMRDAVRDAFDELAEQNATDYGKTFIEQGNAVRDFYDKILEGARKQGFAPGTEGFDLDKWLAYIDESQSGATAIVERYTNERTRMYEDETKTREQLAKRDLDNALKYADELEAAGNTDGAMQQRAIAEAQYAEAVKKSGDEAVKQYNNIEEALKGIRGEYNTLIDSVRSLYELLLENYDDTFLSKLGTSAEELSTALLTVGDNLNAVVGISASREVNLFGGTSGGGYAKLTASAKEYIDAAADVLELNDRQKANLSALFPHIDTYAEKYGVAREALIALINTESRFNADADSGAAKGFGQFKYIPEAESGISVVQELAAKMRDLGHEGANTSTIFTDLGMHVEAMTYHFTKHGDQTSTLEEKYRAYNAGLGNMNKGYKETIGHQEKSMDSFRKLQAATKDMTVETEDYQRAAAATGKSVEELTKQWNVATDTRINSELRDRVAHMIEQEQLTGRITSGMRDVNKQQELYQKYLAGGPLAAKPGTSMHEHGEALDYVAEGTEKVTKAMAEQYGLKVLLYDNSPHVHLELLDKGNKSAAESTSALTVAQRVQNAATQDYISSLSGLDRQYAIWKTQEKSMESLVRKAVDIQKELSNGTVLSSQKRKEYTAILEQATATVQQHIAAKQRMLEQEKMEIELGQRTEWKVERDPEEIHELAKSYDKVFAARTSLNVVEADVKGLLKDNAISQKAANQAVKDAEIAYARAQGPMGAFYADLRENTFDIEKVAADTLSGLVDNFADALIDGKADFKSFADDILKQMARMALNTIVVNFAGNFLGMGGSGAEGIAGGLMKGGLTGDPNTSILGSGGMTSAVSNFTKLFGGNSVGSSIGSFMLGGQQNLMLAQQTAGMGVNSLWQSGATNLANTSNLAMGLGGAAGGFASKMLFDFDTQAESIGHTIGSAGGTALGAAMAPLLGPLAPLGPLLGSFLGGTGGGFLGGLFGGEKKPRMKANLWNTGGEIEIGDTNDMSQEAVQALNDMVDQANSAIQSYAGALGQGAVDALENVSHSFMKVPEGMLGERVAFHWADSIIAAVRGAADQASVDGEIVLADMYRDAAASMSDVIHTKGGLLSEADSKEIERLYRETFVDSGVLALENSGAKVGEAFRGVVSDMLSVVQDPSMLEGSFSQFTSIIGEFGATMAQMTGVEVTDLEGAAAVFADYWKEFDHLSDNLGESLQIMVVAMGHLDSVVDLTATSLDGLDAKQIADLAKDLEPLAQQTAQYYELFYSEAERTAKSVAAAEKTLVNAFDDIGLAVPESKEEFRGLVEAIDLTTDEGLKLYNSLMNLAPGFAFVADNSEALLQDLDAAVQYSLLGNSGELASGVRNLLDGVVYEGLDAGPAFAEMIESYIVGTMLDSISQMMQTAVIQPLIDSIAQGALTGGLIDGVIDQAALDDVVAQAQLTAEGLGAALSDPKVKAAFDSIGEALNGIGLGIGRDQGYDAAQAKRDLAIAESRKAAEDEARKAAEEAQQEAERIAQERQGLLKEELNLLGDIAAIRAMELEEIDASNREIKQRIWALQDEQAIMEAFPESIDAMAETVELFRDLGLELPRSSSAMAEYIASLDLSNEDLQTFAANIGTVSEAMSVFDGLAEAADGLVDKTWIDQMTTAASAMNAAGLSMPLTIEGLIDLLNSPDLSPAHVVAVTDALGPLTDGLNGSKAALESITQAADGLGNTDWTDQMEATTRLFASLGRTMPTTTDGLKAFLESVNADSFSPEQIELINTHLGDMTGAFTGLDQAIESNIGNLRTLKENLQGALNPDLSPQLMADNLSSDLGTYSDLPGFDATMSLEAFTEAFERVSDSASPEVIAQWIEAGGLLLEYNSQMDLVNENIRTVTDSFARLGYSVDGLQTIEGASNQDLAAQSESYYSNFIPEEEQLANLKASIGGIFDELSLAVPETKEGFRSLIESFDPMTASGQEAITSLLGISEAFAQVADASAAADEAIASERLGLEQQFMQLQGDTAGLRQLELDALDKSNHSLQVRIWALESEQAIAGERSGLEQQLMQLQGDTAGLRQIELSALDESNRALQLRIWGLETEQAIANERLGLERQLLELQGDTAALRQLELDALDVSNHALQRRIWALQDEQEASRLAEQERDSVDSSSSRSTSTQSYDDHGLSGYIDRIRALEIEILYASDKFTEARQRELDAIHASVQAYQKRIWSLEEELRILKQIKNVQEGFETVGLSLGDIIADFLEVEIDAIKGRLEEKGGWVDLLGTPFDNALQTYRNAQSEIARTNQQEGLLTAEYERQSSAFGDVERFNVFSDIDQQNNPLVQDLGSKWRESVDRIGEIWSAGRDTTRQDMESQTSLELQDFISGVSAQYGDDSLAVRMAENIYSKFAERAYKDNPDQYTNPDDVPTGLISSAEEWQAALNRANWTDFFDVDMATGKLADVFKWGNAAFHEQYGNERNAAYYDSQDAKEQIAGMGWSQETLDAAEQALNDLFGDRDLALHQMEQAITMMSDMDIDGALIDEFGNINEALLAEYSAVLDELEEIEKRFTEDFMQSFADAMDIDIESADSTFQSVAQRLSEMAYTEEEIAEIRKRQAQDALRQYEYLEGFDSSMGIREFREQLESLAGTVSADTLGQWWAAASHMMDLNEALEVLGETAESTSDAVDNLKKLRELDIAIMEAIGQTDLAKLMRREDELADLREQGYNDAVIGKQQELWALQDAIETADQALAQLQASIQEDLDALTESYESQKAILQERIGLEQSLAQALNRTSELRAAELAQLDPSNRGIQEALYGIEDAQSAYDALEAAIDGQINGVDENTKALRALADQMDDLIESMRSDPEEQSRDALAQIRNILNTGNVPGVEELSDLISSVQVPGTDAYSTETDYLRERAAIANDLESLKELMLEGDSAPLDEQMVDALNQQLEEARKRLDALLGIDSEIKTVTTATEDFDRAMRSAQDKIAALDQLTLAELYAQGDALDTRHEQEVEAMNQQLELAQSQYDALLNVDSSVLAVEAAVNAVQSAISGLSGAIASPTQVVSSPSQPGGSPSSPSQPGGSPSSPEPTRTIDSIVADISAVLGENQYVQMAGASYRVGGLDAWHRVLSVSQYEEAARNAGIPGYAEGGTHSGGLRLVGESGPELEVTGPSHIVPNQAINNLFDTSDLEAEIRALREEVSTLRNEQRRQHHASLIEQRDTADTLKKWDTVGQPSEREEA